MIGKSRTRKAEGLLNMYIIRLAEKIFHLFGSHPGLDFGQVFGCEFGTARNEQEDRPRDGSEAEDLKTSPE